MNDEQPNDPLAGIAQFEPETQAIAELPPEEADRALAARDDSKALDALNNAGESQSREAGAFARICNAAIADGIIQNQDIEYMRGALPAIGARNPELGARLVRSLVQNPEILQRLRRLEPSVAASTLVVQAEEIAALSALDDSLSVEEFVKQRQQQIAEKNRPSRTYVSRSASHPDSDKMSSEQWLKARNAELAKQGRR
jgi:hypothetical protein